MQKKLQKIIKEEINRQVKAFDLSSPKEIKKVLNELFTFSTSSLLKNIGSQEEVLDEKDALPEENWVWLIDMINQSFNETPEEWKKGFKKIKLVILCHKFFTRQDLIKLKEVEESLKVEMKKYFSALQNYSDLDNFREKFFNLPSEIIKNFTRYILNKSKQLNSEITIDKKELKEKIGSLAEDRKKIIEKIALISKKYQTVFELEKTKELYDNGLFWEDNFLNRAVNEYIGKLLNHEAAMEHIKDTFNSAFLYDMKWQAENSASYLKHIESIKTEEAKEYFTPNGYQIGVRFDNEIEIAKNKSSQEGFVVDKNSRFKEPNQKIQSVAYPWETNGEAPGADGNPDAAGAAGGTSGGGDASGGGIDFGGGFSGGEDSGLDGSMADDGTVPEGGEDAAVDGVETPDTGAEGDMPTDEDGFPVDFGTPDDTGSEDDTTPDDEKKK